MTVKGSVDGQGKPVLPGLRGTVIGHLGQLAIVTLDGPEYEHQNVLIPDGAFGLDRQSQTRRIEIAPTGVVRPSRERERYRQGR